MTKKKKEEKNKIVELRKEALNDDDLILVNLTWLTQKLNPKTKTEITRRSEADIDSDNLVLVSVRRGNFYFSLRICLNLKASDKSCKS